MNKIILAFILTMLPACALDYDYSSTLSVPVKMQITEEISTKIPINEGQKIKLKVIDGNNVIKNGEIVTAEVETIITSGMNGFPAEIIIDNFDIPGIKQTQLVSTYTKKGQNRCLWVYPLKWALTPIPFVGSLTNFIKGGHAFIRKNDVITVYYYPEWK